MPRSQPTLLDAHRPRWQLGILIENGARAGAVWLRIRPPEECGCCSLRWFTSNLVHDDGPATFEAERTELMPVFRRSVRRIDFHAWAAWWHHWHDRRLVDRVLADIVAGRSQPHPPGASVCRRPKRLL